MPPFRRWPNYLGALARSVPAFAFGFGVGLLLLGFPYPLPVPPSSRVPRFSSHAVMYAGVRVSRIACVPPDSGSSRVWEYDEEGGGGRKKEEDGEGGWRKEEHGGGASIDGVPGVDVMACGARATSHRSFVVRCRSAPSRPRHGASSARSAPSRPHDSAIMSGKGRGILKAAASGALASAGAVSAAVGGGRKAARKAEDDRGEDTGMSVTRKRHKSSGSGVLRCLRCQGTSQATPRLKRGSTGWGSESRDNFVICDSGGTLGVRLQPDVYSQRDA